MKYRKKPVVIEAIQIPYRDQPDHGSTVGDLFAFMGKAEWEIGNDGLRITTLEGVMLASPGDWIIRGVAGELYPCKPEIFDQTYEAAE